MYSFYLFDQLKELFGLLFTIIRNNTDKKNRVCICDFLVFLAMNIKLEGRGYLRNYTSKTLITDRCIKDEIHLESKGVQKVKNTRKLFLCPSHILYKVDNSFPNFSLPACTYRTIS